MNLTPPSERQSIVALREELEADYHNRTDDEVFWGIVQCGDGRDNMSVFGDTDISAVECTGYAIVVVQKERKKLRRADVWGFWGADNPASLFAAPHAPASGHDFALVEDRFIVDPWVSGVECNSDRTVFDLEDPDHAAEVRRIYGDRSKWEKVSFSASCQQ